MAQVIDLPLEDGEMLLVRPTVADEPLGGLGLASSAEDKVKKAGETLESALAQITPTLQVVAGKLGFGRNDSFLGTDHPVWFAGRLAACQLDGRQALAAASGHEQCDAVELDAALGAPGLIRLLLSGHPDGPSIAGTGQGGSAGGQYQIIATRHADITGHGGLYSGSRWGPDRPTPAAGAPLESSQRPMTSAEEARSLPEDSAPVQAAQAESGHETALVSPAVVSESPRTGRQQTPRTTPGNKDFPPDKPVPSVRVPAPTVYESPTAGRVATGSCQADARRWASRHGPGRGVSASSSQTGTFA